MSGPQRYLAAVLLKLQATLGNNPHGGSTAGQVGCSLEGARALLEGALARTYGSASPNAHGLEPCRCDRLLLCRFDLGAGFGEVALKGGAGL